MTRGDQLAVNAMQQLQHDTLLIGDVGVVLPVAQYPLVNENDITPLAALVDAVH